MSLFVAVRPDEDAVDDLQHRLERVRRLPVASDLRWQPPSQWHVTLAFLGADDAHVSDDVAQRLVPLSDRARIEGVRIVGAGCFGRQILWMGLADTDAVTALSDIAAAIPPLLRGSGVTPDRRPWRPHLTVARARHGDARPLVDVLAGYEGQAWCVDELVLIRSTGGPQPAHHVVSTIPLAEPELPA
jgi:RNA 2',3'-cyclic 3'-phosphodiesterase